jgi:hypothetical protein
MNDIGLINELLDMEKPDVSVWEGILDWDILNLSRIKGFIKIILNSI